MKRTTEQVIDAVATLEGAGFLVHRSFPTPALDILDPFLLLDEMGPSDLGPGEAKGAPDHPHRGFETVTYMIDGAMEHLDSSGNSGRIGPGGPTPTLFTNILPAEAGEPPRRRQGCRRSAGSLANRAEHDISRGATLHCSPFTPLPLPNRELRTEN